MTSKTLLIITSVLLIAVGLTWLVAPALLFNLLGLQVSPDMEFMGRRYSAYVLGLVVMMWMARAVPNTAARRALMMGAFVTITITAATSLYGALTFGPAAWGVFVSEALLSLGFAYFLFIKPEPVIK